MSNSSIAKRPDDPYQILGVERNASQDEIKRAYRVLAMTYHPDTHPEDPDAKRKFIDIAYAYETIGNPEARAHYDTTGQVKRQNDLSIKAYQKMSTMFMNEIMNRGQTATKMDLITSIRRQLAAEQRKHKSDIKGIEKEQKFLSDILSRLECEDDTEPVLLNCVEDAIDGMEKAKYQSEQEILLAKKCSELLKGYTFRFDQHEDPMMDSYARQLSDMIGGNATFSNAKWRF